METRININYTPSKTSEVFGLFTLSFQGSDGKVHSVNTKFNPKQLWEFSRDTSSVAFDLLVLSMIVYNVDRAVLRLSNSDDGWKRNLILLNVPVINLEDMNKGREAFNKAINFLKQSVGELRKSTWLSRQEVVQSTILVAIVVALVSAYVSVIDFGLTKVLGFVIGGR